MPTPNNVSTDHSHPCNFRLHRHRDRGWGELAFEYRWDSTGGVKGEDGLSNPDLEHCSLYEMTTYAENVGIWCDGFYFPPDPPFVGWKFRDPTDGRTGPVGMECFAASQGWAWDRHKLGGNLLLPSEAREFSIRAVQRYCFRCEVCGLDAPVSGPDDGPHLLRRTFAPLRQDEETLPTNGLPVWRYAFCKQNTTAWLDLDREGYVADSANIGFGPGEF